MITNVNIFCIVAVTKDNIHLINRAKGHSIAEGEQYEVGDEVELIYEMYNDLGFNDAIIDFAKVANQDRTTIKIKTRHDWE